MNRCPKTQRLSERFRDISLAVCLGLCICSPKILPSHVGFAYISEPWLLSQKDRKDCFASCFTPSLKFRLLVSSCHANPSVCSGNWLLYSGAAHWVNRLNKFILADMSSSNYTCLLKGSLWRGNVFIHFKPKCFILINRVNIFYYAYNHYLNKTTNNFSDSEKNKKLWRIILLITKWPTLCSLV